MTEVARSYQLELVPEDARTRKSRGAFFTPPAIARYLANWAIGARQGIRILDPTCGDGVFLSAAALELGERGLKGQLYGVDIHEPSLDETTSGLEANEAEAYLICDDFFNLSPPNTPGAYVPEFDAVIGNPPFIRYQHHKGPARRAAAMAALRQGVRLSGLASSWAAFLVHAASFLKADGRLAMVLPAELLTVGYAEPVRKWLRERFEAVNLVVFEKLQFDDALENVVLLLAEGTGGCDAFSLYFVHSSEDLEGIQPLDGVAAALPPESRWTSLLLGARQRSLFKEVVGEAFVPLKGYGPPQLGIVTGANHFFTLNEATRQAYRLEEGRHVVKISPPGTRHLRGLAFTTGDWKRLRDENERVWMLFPEAMDLVEGLADYIAIGQDLGVPAAYKCQIRTPWWKPPRGVVPDLFFTYMSHHFPRIVANRASVGFVNSMHGVQLKKDISRIAKDALPLLCLNSVTLLGAELHGRSYGGGILKMEPSEAAALPVPNEEMIENAWKVLQSEREIWDYQLRKGHWTNVVARVDEVLLGSCIGLNIERLSLLRDAATVLRARRLARSAP